MSDEPSILSIVGISAMAVHEMTHRIKSSLVRVRLQQNIVKLGFIRMLSQQPCSPPANGKDAKHNTGKPIKKAARHRRRGPPENPRSAETGH
jgi:hypothetical protein